MAQKNPQWPPISQRKLLTCTAILIRRHILNMRTYATICITSAQLDVTKLSMSYVGNLLAKYLPPCRGRLKSQLLCRVAVFLVVLATIIGIPVTHARDTPNGVLVRRDGTIDLTKSLSTISLTRPLRSDGGTISFWVLPEWPIPRTTNQPFVAVSWRDGRQGYLVVSQGWWAGIGRSRLTFVFNNQDGIACTAEEELPVRIWSMVTATWRGGLDGYCKLYVDDRLLAEYRFRQLPSLTSGETLFLGSDFPTTERRDRQTTGVMRDLLILDHPATHRDVIDRYEAQIPAEEILVRGWAWMTNAPPATRSKSDTGVQGVQALAPKIAVFEESVAWATSRISIDQRIESLAAAGVTAYFPCVWHGSFARYPTSMADIEPTLSKQIRSGWDPVAYLIQRARDHRIQIHPWFTVAYRGPNGGNVVAENGVPELANDIHSQAFQRKMVSVLDEFMSRYEVHGINLDYVRAMGICVSTSCRSNYSAMYHSTLLDDVAKRSSDPDARARIVAWQDGAMSQLISAVSQTLKRRQTAPVLSVDGHVVDESLRPLEGRNEIDWIQKGWVDLAFHMDYARNLHVKEFDDAKMRTITADSLALLISNYDLVDGQAVPRSGEWLRRVISYANTRWQPPLIGIYDWKHVTPDQIRAICGLTHAGPVGGDEVVSNERTRQFDACN